MIKANRYINCFTRFLFKALENCMKNILDLLNQRRKRALSDEIMWQSIGL